MAYRWLTDLDAALRAAGVPFVEVGPSSLDPTGAATWRQRGRPASTGAFDPVGVVCHHTASPAGTTDQADLNVILAGNGSAPGPISHTYLGRSGTIYLVAAGRCNHAGSGKRPGLDTSCRDQNALNVGIEAGNNGVGERWPDAMCDAYAALVGALCAWYRWPLEAVYLHATTGPPSGGCNSKIDPAGPWERQPNLVGSTTWDLNTWRAYVAEHWPGSSPPLEQEDEMTDDDFARIRQICKEEVNSGLTAWLRSPEYQNQIVEGNAREGANSALTGWLRSPEYNNIVQQACREALAEVT